MAPSLTKAANGDTNLDDGSKPSSCPFTLEKSNFKANGHVILSDVPENITFIPSPYSTAGCFVGFDVAEPSSRHVVPVGQLKDIRFMSIFRFKVWWTTHWVGSNGRDLENETQIVILESSDAGRPYVVVLPLLEGSFRACIQPGNADFLDICVESGSTREVSKAFQSVLYLHAGDDPFALVKEAVKVARDHLGTFQLLEDKTPPGIVDKFGWCTWDAFYLTVHPHGVIDGVRKLVEGGCPPGLVLLDDGWQSIGHDSDPITKEGMNQAVAGEQMPCRLLKFEENYKFRDYVSPNGGASGKGMGAFIKDLKEEFKSVDYVYVWHALCGYWGGIRPNVPGMPDAVVVEPTLSPGLQKTMEDLAVDKIVATGVGLVPPEVVAELASGPQLKAHGTLKQPNVVDDGSKAIICFILSFILASLSSLSPCYLLPTLVSVKPYITLRFQTLENPHSTLIPSVNDVVPLYPITEGPMNPSTLTPQRSVLHSPFLNPISLPAATSGQTRRRRFRVSFPRNSATPSDQSTGSTSTPPPDVFGGKRELTGIQPVVVKLSPPLRLATSAIVIAGAVAAGYGLGLRLSKSQNAAFGGAAVLGAAGGAAAYALTSCAPEVAAIDLHNYVAGVDDPKAVKKEDIEDIARKYGVSKQDEAFNAELCDLYCRFVTSVLPPGAEELKGDEVETIVSFKNSLGIDDPEAASMHMEIGRRIFRQRLETDREGDLEQRRAFQKLIYVSTLVFGDASSFLLPWKRVFKITDSQVELAIRDNAQRLYASKLKSVGRDIDAEQLVRLKEAQHAYRLSDEYAEDLFKEHTRKLVEANISAALSLIKSRTRAARGVTQVVEELEKMLAFNSLLISLKNQPDAARFAPGVGPISLLGGEYYGDRKIDDLKLLFRAYVTDSLSTGRLEENKLSALNQLRNIFGLGKREAESIVLDITSKVYRKRLSQAVSAGELEAADSKAAFLQNICEELHFDPERASQIHEEIYRQKLQLCVADGELNEEDVAALLRLRVMLCIPQQTVEAAHSDICGSLFEKVVKDAIASGVDGYDADVKQAVRKAAHGLRLSREAAMSIASKAVRKIFINYVKRARSVGSRTEAAKELKKMIAFNTLVVTELVADIKGESSDTSTEEPIKEQEIEVLEDEEWESIQTLRKIRPDKELAAKLGKPGQTEITLKDDLQERERTDLYKTYLLFCITGEVKRIPFGAQITTKKDDSEYVLLNQLGGILGLSTTEIVEVHRSLAEQAFRQQAEVILADGQLTKARVEQLNELQKQVGLPPQYVQKIIKNITTTKMAAAIETAIGQGRLNIKQIRELKESSVDLDSMISETLRESLFKKTVDEIFSSGTGEFDEEEVYEKIPLDLNINAEKAKNVVQELARSRLSNSLIQAVSLLRQRNRQGVVSSLNDLLACDKAVPAKPLSWDVPEELADLFAIYLKSDPAPEKLLRLQYLLDINDSTAASLREMGDRLQPIGAEEENFAF